jgi:hypothetical protein
LATNSPSIGSFIGGLFVGVILGGVASLLVTLLLLEALSRFSVNPVYGFVGVYALGVLFGILALRLIRARLDFVSGLATGGAASFLGVTALCNTLLGGLGSMR